MKPTTKTAAPVAPAVPTSGGSWLLDEATGALTRVQAAPETPIEPGVETPVEPALKEVR